MRKRGMMLAIAFCLACCTFVLADEKEDQAVEAIRKIAVNVRYRPDAEQANGSVFLAGAKVTDAVLKEVKQLHSLRVLVLADTNVTDEGLKEIKELTKLISLSLN